jgi:hypothetical protein
VRPGGRRFRVAPSPAISYIGLAANMVGSAPYAGMLRTDFDKKSLKAMHISDRLFFKECCAFLTAANFLLQGGDGA